MKIKNSALITCIAELAAKHPQGRALLQAKLGEGAPSAKRRKISVESISIQLGLRTVNVFI